MSSPTPRASVTGIPPYVAGKPPAARPGLTTFKLSSNENPYPPLPGVLDAAVEAAGRINRYPDMGSSELYAKLATVLGVPEEQLAVATGSSGLIYGLMQAFCDPGDEVVYAWRSFEAYPIAVSVAGAVNVQVPILADGRHDLDAMADAITDRTKVVVLCTPNNPTGPALTQTEVDSFLARVPEHVVVMIDEAYVEFVRVDDPVDGMATMRARENVVLMRTFSKAYGLAGLRVGYAIAPEPIAAALRAVVLPFAINSVAQAAASASLDAREALLERVDDVVAERTRVVAGLREAGWDVPDAQGNFVWFDFTHDPDRIALFAAAADDAGIVVRPLGAHGIRATIGEPEANDRLIALAGSFAQFGSGGE